jgi:hypothetical protein
MHDRRGDKNTMGYPTDATDEEWAEIACQATPIFLTS